MQIFNLKESESIILEISGKKVKLTLLPKQDDRDEFVIGIDAPRTINIAREEVFNTKKS
jgi:sRNA-binding carbon storage regulator CsrA